MKTTTGIVRKVCAMALASLVAHFVWADRVIAINFNAGQGRGNAGNAANKLADDTAIAVGSYTINGQYWNQYQCAASANHEEGVTVYDTEAGTTETMSMIVKTTAGGNYTVDGVSSPAQQTVTNGYMDDGSGVKVELTTAPFDRYDIILIQATDTDSRKFAPSIVNGVLYKADANGNAVLAAHKTDNWGASRTTDVTLGTNAMRVNNLCGPLTIYGGRNLSSAQRGGIAALVVIERTTRTAQVYLANEDCTASNAGGVGTYKPTEMTIPNTAVAPTGTKLWIDAVQFAHNTDRDANKSGYISIGDTRSIAPVVDGEWNVTSLDASSSMGPRMTFAFPTPAEVTVGTTATMDADVVSRIRLYKYTTDNTIKLDAAMDQWRPAYQISARIPACATISGTVASWADMTWEEKNSFYEGAPTKVVVTAESTLTLGSAVSCAEVVITGSADLTITDPQNLTYTKLDLSGFTGRLILDHTSSTVINDHVGDNTTDYLMGNVVGGTIVLKGSSILGLTKINNNPIALDGTTLRIEGGLVKVNSKDQSGNLKNATIELAGGRIYNYGWFESSGTMTLDATTDTSIFCKYCSGAPAIVKKGTAKVSFEAGDTGSNFTSIKAEAGTLAFSGNAVTATTLLAGEGFIEIPSGKTLNVGSLAGEGNINVTGAGTLKVQNDSDFAGTLNLSGGVTLDLGTMRPSFAMATTDTAAVKIQVGATDDGKVTLNGAVGNVTVVDGGNTALEATKTTEGSTTVVTFPITVSGKACWVAYEFNGNLNSTGSDTTSLARDQDDRQYRYGDDATSDFRPAGEGYDALYAGSHPWRNITYKDSFTCAMYGTLPKADETGLVVFGSTTSSPQGLIGLMTGSVANNTVLLVRSTGSQNNATKYETMAEMSVPNPFTTPHLYIFSKTGRTIKVYLDGILWTTYESATDFVIGPGFQICSVHGGSYTTGINRFAPPSRDAAQNQAIYKDCVIDSLRLYDGVLGEKAIAELVKEFPYVSPNGSYSRTVADVATWTEENAWTKASDSSTVESPVAGSALTLHAANADAAVTVNLDETTTYEAITFGGVEGSAIAVKKGTGLVVNAGQTVVTVPTTIAMGAMTIAGGPTVITGAGSLAFDYSALDVNAYTADAFIQLTGMMDEAGDKVTCTLPAESAYANRAVSFGYDTASKTYRITISCVSIAIPTVAGMDVAVTVDGAAVAIANGAITLVPGTAFTVTYTPQAGYCGSAVSTDYTAGAETTVTAPEVPAAAVAQVAGVNYATVDEALANIGSNQFVTLLADVTVTAPIEIPAEFYGAINLNGHTITRTVMGSYVIKVPASAYLELGGNGGIVNTAEQYPYAIENKGTTVLRGMAVTGMVTTLNGAWTFVEKTFNPTAPVTFYMDWNSIASVPYLAVEESVGSDKVTVSYREFQGTGAEVYHAIPVTAEDQTFQGLQDIYTVYSISQYAQAALVTKSATNATIEILSGTYELNNATTADQGATVTFTVTPDEGYVLKTVTVNGEAVSADAEGVYSITVDEAVAIAAVANAQSTADFHDPETITAETTAVELGLTNTAFTSDDGTTLKAVAEWAKAQSTSLAALNAVDPEVAGDAYLLNVAPNTTAVDGAKTAFAFDATDLAALLADPCAKPTIGTGSYNGTVKIFGAETVDGKYIENNESAKFFKATLTK